MLVNNNGAKSHWAEDDDTNGYLYPCTASSPIVTRLHACENQSTLENKAFVSLVSTHISDPLSYLLVRIHTFQCSLFRSARYSLPFAPSYVIQSKSYDLLGLKVVTMR